MVELIYALFFALAVGSALMVVFSSHVVHSALHLIVTMVAIAAIFVLIGSQFAAALQIVVYAGAIMVLFLFVIMLLNLGRAGAAPRETRFVRRMGGLLFIALSIQGAILASRFGALETAPEAERAFGFSEVALTLMTRYLYAFELTSIVLLVAVVGAMALARRSIVAQAARSGDSLS
jgi:NADH-quinone oxidoreductase subunit J